MWGAGRRILRLEVVISLVVDTLRGAQQGERRILPVLDRVTFGRHPDNHVVFDAQHDMDASSRHAEIVHEGERYLLHDIGSSHGTWVEGVRVEEFEIGLENSVVVEFGTGGPILQLWIGPDISRAPVVLGQKKGWRRFLPW